MKNTSIDNKIKDSGPHDIFPDLLECLGVPHTYEYSEERFRNMPFHSMFGLMHLLEEYGVECEGLHLSDKGEMSRLPTPMIAQTRQGGYIIVTHIDRGRASYLTEGVPEHISTQELTAACTGNVLLTRATVKAEEPDFTAHARKEMAITLRNRGIVVLCMAFCLYLLVAQGILHSLSTTLIVFFDLLGLSLSVMLTSKSLGIRSKTVTKMCSVLQEGGCDKVLENKGSKFFSIFGWSEVGLAYFGVSLTALIVFPSSLPYLALCNACCLPFTLWSIWYQKTRVKAWCTLCVSVQCTLWLLFFCYLGGGWFAGLNDFNIIPLMLLGASYLLALLSINLLTGMFNSRRKTIIHNEYERHNI